MRQALHALTTELRRLKTSGVRTLAVSEESLAALRSVIQERAKSTRAALSGSAPSSPDSSPKNSETPARSVEPEPKPTLRYSAPVTAAPSDSKIPEIAPVVALPEGDKATKWAALRELVLKDAVCCANVRPGKKVVLGVGSLDAKIMFVGEAPGADEEVQGEPFVGPAGQLLTKMIQAMGLKREEVYIGNVMNWRPQLPVTTGAAQVGNRQPTEGEMRYCLPYLRAQIDVVNPDLLVALGATAAQGLLGFGSFRALGDIRGRWQLFAGKPLMVTYHPSYILRSQSNRSKRMIWEDLLKVMERAGLSISDRQRNFFLEK